ncbi:hypothetical protein [Alloactinosynnema sp. L-07]|nr:hypothetical protein [Alloactinosynnema sp. L-07]
MTYAQFFDPQAANPTPLPRTPPEASTSAGARAARARAGAPVPRRAAAGAPTTTCVGATRRYYDDTAGSYIACDVCQEAWTEDVRFLREALRTANAVIDRLRAEAETP